MTSKERFLTVLTGGIPDRLPATTHHLMPYFLKKYMNGMSNAEFFKTTGLDPIVWTNPVKADESKGDYCEVSPSGVQRILNSDWNIIEEEIPNQEYQTFRFRFVTPKGELTIIRQKNEYTSWTTEHLVKKPEDIELIAEFCTAPLCDIDEVNRQADLLGTGGMIRGHICCFDGSGQPGCWQDAACMMGIEPLILATYDDPDWVHEFLKIIQRRKLIYTQSLKGARYDLLELGGGDASSTVISPTLFDEFVAPYDEPVIAAAHEAGQRIVYHTCGGMMPILENIAGMKTDAMETFTPVGMGADVDLAEAKRRIGDRVCMIGGLDQGHFFKGCTPAETRAEVRRCFEAAGAGGGYIVCPSDHFFDADPELIKAYADAAHECVYEI